METLYAVTVLALLAALLLTAAANWVIGMHNAELHHHIVEHNHEQHPDVPLLLVCPDCQKPQPSRFWERTPQQ